LTPEFLQKALAEQRTRRHHAPLASVLFELQLVERSALEAVTREHVRDVIRGILEWGYGVVTFKTRNFADDLFVLRDGLSVEELLLDASIRRDESDFETVPQLELEALDFLP
jgi:hypothetical protein